MRVFGLPLVAQLGDRRLLAFGDEDRVEAEALAAAGFLGDAPLERARAAELLLLRRETDELAHVAGPTVVAADAGELPEEPAHRIVAPGTRGFDAGAATERRHLDAGVLSQHPDVGLCHRPTEPRLAARVLAIGVAHFGRKLGGANQLDLPTRQRSLELARLVLVARGEPRLQSLHRTAATCSTSAMRATSRGAGVSRGSTTSSSRRRRSASSLTSTELIRAPARSISSITSPGG